MRSSYAGPPTDWLGGPEEITDHELRAFLHRKGLEPRLTPFFAATQIAEHYDVPLAEAQQMVSELL